MSEEKTLAQDTEATTDSKPGQASQASTPQQPTAEPDVPVIEPPPKLTYGGKEPRLAVQPEFWDDLIDAMPPWIDEISAIALLVFGVISFMALLDVSPDATLSKAWSDTLRSLFGDGSLLIAGGIFLLGVIILLPKAGITIRFSARRLLALEVAFVSTLAIMHLSHGDTELRVLARLGEGGGSIGWGVSVIPFTLFGTTSALFIFATLLVFSLGAVVGIKNKHVVGALLNTSQRLKTFGTNLLESAKPPKAETPPPDVRTLQPKSRLDISARPPAATNVVRIKPDMNNIPPSMRPGAPQPHSPIPDLMDDEESQRLEKALSHAELPPDENPVKASLIGTLVEGKKGPQMVERPDGRVKHYFAVDSMKETKKVGKRDKDLPDLELLRDVEMNPPDETEINHNVVLIENTLMEFDIDIDVIDVKIGPTVTQYAVQPYRESKNDEGENVTDRTRLSKIASLSSDLALSLSAKRLRLELPVPGHSYMGIEVPNKNPSTVTLRSVYESKAYYDFSQKKDSPLAIPLGRDVSGQPVNIDIASLPHMLIGGTTGSGKSVCIAAIATAVLLKNTPDKIKIIMLDPKMVELSRFNGVPHLMGQVETDIERIVGVLRWCTLEMDRRYKMLEEKAARNIETYNTQLGQRRKSEHLPYILIMIDEIGDLMMSKPEETEQAITRLAQMARAVGMHLVVATQRPSVDVITGLIKANFPARIAFAVASSVDSRVILDTSGAENLLGSGDMLYLAQDAAGPKRLQGCFVEDSEVRAVVKHWKDWKKEEEAKGTRFEVAPWERGITRREFLSKTDPMLEDAIDLVIAEQEASASMIQRKLGLGYPRAARIIDLMEELGIIGEQIEGGRNRKVLIEKGQDPFKELIERRAREK